MFKEILERLKSKEISKVKTDSGNKFSEVEVSNVKKEYVEVKRSTIKGCFSY